MSADIWKNYHHTVASHPRHIACVGGKSAIADPAKWASLYKTALQKLLARAVSEGHELGPVGAAWSFSRLVGTDGDLVKMLKHDGVFDIGAFRHTAAPKDARLVLAGGGASIKRLNRALAVLGYSLRTSGSHNAQSTAGAIATGVHGSVLRQGGIQNHVRALYIVTSPTTACWIERASAPTLDDAFIHQFEPSLVRSDALFDAALVHLGGLGLVNAVVLDVDPLFTCNVVARKMTITPDWLDALGQGEYRRCAAQIGHDAEPYYYELNLHPFAPFSEPALHTLYFRNDISASAADAAQGIARSEPFNLVGKAIKRGLNEAPPSAGANALGILQLPCGVSIPWLVALVFKQISFGQSVKTWEQLIGPHTSLVPMYSAALAIPRARLRDVIERMSEAVQDLCHHFIFTVRFVHDASGTLAFTRFGENAVINIDGAGASLSDACLNAAIAISRALDAAGIPFSWHWGKLGTLDAAKVRHDYGDMKDPASAAGKWHAARAALIPPSLDRVISNTALREWGLI
jgi:hypothetical protein